MGGILSRSQRMHEEGAMFQRNLDSQHAAVKMLLDELGEIGGPACAPSSLVGCQSNCHQANCATLLRMADALRDLQCLQYNLLVSLSRDADTIYKLGTLSGTPTVSEQASSALRVEQITAELQLCEGKNTELRSEMEDLRQRCANMTEEHERIVKDAKTQLENEKAQRDALDLSLKQMQILNGTAKAVNSALEALCRSLRVEVLTLHGQIGQLETQANRQGSACGSYLDSGVTPNDLQLLADRMKQALASFTKVLTSGTNGSSVLGGRFGSTEVAGTLGRKSDVKFLYQSMVADTVFCGFEAEDFQIPQCLPSELDWEKKRAENNRQYEELSSMQDNDPETITDLAFMVETLRWRKNLAGGCCTAESSSSKCPPGCSGRAGCVCGRARFFYFCCTKVEALMLSELGEDYRRQPEGNFRSQDTKLCEQLLPLLISLWLSHLLANSFEPPGVLLKMRAGMEFDAGYMEKVVVGDEELNIDGRAPPVAFMLMPGFRLGKSVIRGHVYLQALRPINEEQMIT